jgi:recombination protein RecA
MSLRAKAAIVPISVLSTVWVAFPAGAWVELFGSEPLVKTTITQIIAEAQKPRRTGVLADAEHALDLVYVKKLDVDMDNLLVSQRDYAEQVYIITKEPSRNDPAVV